MKKIFNLIVVDESGSMSSIQQQAFTGMNETIQTIRLSQEKNPELEQRITLITFDSEHTKVHYNDVPAAQCKDLKPEDYSPCACTPLYDAIGKGISMINAKCGAEDNVLVTIITDGYENASCEFNLPMIKNLIEKLKAQNWTFTFIGTDDIDVNGMAADLSIENKWSFSRNGASTAEMFAKDRKSRMRYFNCVANDEAMPEGSYFDDDESH